MFLLSWNVAGWSSTSQAIRESYGSLHAFFECTGADIICIQECKGTLAKLTASPVDMGASDPPPNRRPKVRPLSRLTQSRKSTAGATSAQGSSGGVNDGVEGWESFWSFSGKQHRGFNGVVTFARKGLTWRCDSQPFDEEEFNEEGRAVVTHHSAFVLVNVYVPNARGGVRHSFKFGFLRALEQQMEKLRRETGKPVVLVGDLNMTYRAMDGAWSLRRIHLGTLLQLEAFAKAKTDVEWAAALPHLPKPALQRVVNMIAHYLCARVVDSAKMGGEGQGESTTDATSASALSPLSPATPGTGVVSVDNAVLVDGDAIDRAALDCLREELLRGGYTAAAATRVTQMCEAPPVSLRALYEAGFRNAYASEFAKSFPCAHNNELYAVVRYCGLPPHSDASAAVMGRLLQLPLATSSMPVLARRLPWATAEPAAEGEKEEGGSASSGDGATRMFDSFLLTEGILNSASAVSSGRATTAELDALLLTAAEQPLLDPYCPCPYTCWDQSRNRRLENVGTRLDYILVDAALLPAVQCRGESANNVCAAAVTTRPAREDFFSEVSGAQYRDGVQRAMAGGAYPPAPFDGSGMPALAEGARELCCDGLPATGLFVTPPQFSDHIGVGLVLDLTRLGHGSELLQRTGKLEDAHRCMYRPPVGLHTFFAAAAATKKTAPTTSAVSTVTPTVASVKATDGSASGGGGGTASSAGIGASPVAAPDTAERAQKRARVETTEAPTVDSTVAEAVDVVDVDEL